MLFAHGVGSRGDLPLPLWMFTWASALALVISFVALGVLWPRPRLANASEGRLLSAHPLPAAVNVMQWLGRLAALVLFLTALWAGLFGADDTSNNLLPVSLYVVVWVGAQVVGGLIGDLWRAINPLDTLSLGIEKVLGDRSVPAPRQLGHWPAAVGLFVFLFYELAHPSGSTPRTLGAMLLVHTVVSLGLGVRFGRSWLAEHEPFSALFAMIGAMAPISVDEAGLRVRPLMSGLSKMSVLPGTLAALLIVLGGTTFDGFSESEAGRSILGRPEGWGGAVTQGLGLIASIIFVTLLFAAGIWWTQRVTTHEASDLADAFTSSLVPIVFGYAVAHYAQLLVDEIQSFIFRLSDPGGLGWDLFGGADGEIDFTIISPDVIAWTQVLAVLLGHIGAVVVAHDRSVELFSVKESLRSQFAMLLVMVGYSTLGLWLLLNA